MKIIYRVTLRVGYSEAFFDFSSAEIACGFAKVALEHSVSSEDTKRATQIYLTVINEEEEEKKED